MVKSRKIAYFCLFTLLNVQLSISFTKASNIINKQDNGIGPGYIEKKTDYIVDIISTNSSIYVHDGVKYIKGELKGNYYLTGYCACKKCGTGTGITASGKRVRENHTIAADWKILPKGTMVILENAVGKDGTKYDGVYQVEDRGGGVKNKHIDIYRPTHDLAALVTYYGKCYGDVYIALPLATNSEIK